MNLVGRTGPSSCTAEVGVQPGDIYGDKMTVRGEILNEF